MPNGTLPEAETLLGEKRRLAGMEAELPSMASKLREALMGRLEHPMMEQRAKALEEFYTAGPRAREEIALSPVPIPATSAQRMIAQERAAALTPVMGLSSLIGAKLGSISDVIQRATGAFESMVGAQQGRVGLAQTGYDLALQALAEQREQEMQPYDIAYRQALTKQALKPPAGTIKTPVEQAIEKMILDLLTAGGEAPTETKPMYTPKEGKGAISPEGQWYFQGSEYYPDDWIPVID